MEGTAVGNSQLEVGMQLVAVEEGTVAGQGMALEEGTVVGVGQRVWDSNQQVHREVGILRLVVETSGGIGCWSSSLGCCDSGSSWDSGRSNMLT